MDCLGVADKCREVVFVKCAQIGGTELGNNWLGWIIDHNPAPIMVVWPSLDVARRNSKLRIDPLIDESPCLRTKVGDKRAADGSNTVMQKDFIGGTMVITGANSAKGLRSMPARYLFLDEVDAFPLDIDGEGDPIELARARSRTFAKRKAFLNSTPTIDGESKIWERWEKSDMAYCYVPCPICKEKQRLVFKNLKWDKDNTKDVWYRCEHCKGEIRNWQKTKMLKEYEWRKENPESEIRGFHMNGLYSPVGWLSWEDIVDLWLEAQDDQTKLKTFINTVLAECWKEPSENPGWNRLYERRELYDRNVVPKEAVFLTAGVDIQANRIEVEIVAWGPDKVSWSIDYRILMGDIKAEDTDVWDELDKLLNETWPSETDPNVRIPLKIAAIDTGFETQTVYNFCRKYSQTRVCAVKGHDGLNLSIGIPRAVDVTIAGKTIKRGLRLWPVGVSILKAELYRWLAQDKAEDQKAPKAGYCFFPQYGAEYFRSLTAEALRYRVVRGFRKAEWVKIRDRNEALDCRVYARAAAAIAGIDRFQPRDWQRLRAQLIDPIKARKQTGEHPEKKKRKQRGNSWL